MSIFLDLIESGKPIKLIKYVNFKKVGEVIMNAPKECDYEEMTKSVGGQSQPQPYHDEPMVNGYEGSRKSFMGNNGFDWSGMKGGK